MNQSPSATETVEKPAKKQWLFYITPEEAAPLEQFRSGKRWTRQTLFEEMRREYCEAHRIEFVSNGRRIA